jgi:divalent metal cation (Fe/Co/Zn/Cd) transporter
VTAPGTGGEDLRQIRRVTWWGLVINVGLSALKFVVGIAGSSQAVVADAVHAIRTRMVGAAVYLDMHVLVHGDLSVRCGHEIAEKAKAELVRSVPGIADVVVHIEPIEEPAACEDG